MNTQKKIAIACIAVNSIVLLAFAYIFGLFPLLFVVRHLPDPALREPGIPKSAVWMHERLTPRHDAWARARIASDRPLYLTTDDLVETEWPLFGSVFYLWTTEALQTAHGAGSSAVPVAPAEYAAAAIDSATELVLDPAHAEWVRQHWGERYLQYENAFYRMLILSAATAHAQITGSMDYGGLIQLQALSLAREIDRAPHGLIDDYPGECYPGDVMASLAAVSRANGLVQPGGDPMPHRLRRGLEAPTVDATGLPPYIACARSGRPIGPSRGCSNSYLVFLAAEVWPEKAEEWYALYEEHFWQERAGAVGFREYPRSLPEYDWQLGDMDAGPIAGGFGMAASAFGLAAARSVGRYDHAYPLAAQMLAASWPLPDGTLLLPRILSNTVDAPHLGESCILFNLTRQPAEGMPIVTGGRVPLLVYLILGAYLAGTVLLVLAALQRLRPLLRGREPGVRFPWLQGSLWAAMMATAFLLLMTGQYAAGLIVLVACQVLPRVKFAS